MDGMPPAPTAPYPTFIEVPAVEADGGLLALLPESVVKYVEGLPAGLTFVMVDQSSEATAAIAELKSADGRSGAAYREKVFSPGVLSKDQITATPAATALLTRVTRALTRATDVAEDASVHRALARPSDLSAVIDLLSSTLPFLSAERDLDPDLDARVVALAGEHDLILRAGGLKDAKWVSDYLMISPKSVSAKARRKELLAIPRGDRSLFPAIQFRDGQTLPGLRETLDALPVTNGWSRLSFLLQPNPGLDDRTPLDALATDRAAVLAVAAELGDQGAA